MSESSATRLLREVRWPNGVKCIHYGSLSIIGWG
ncbi:MAG: transposase [Thaumarchaeota archaeon]|nr:transposase [Candidatus Geocrenenecus arthurdayi]